MRFMLMVIATRDGSAAPGAAPSEAAVAKMAQYNTSLRKAGVMLALDGLLPPSTAARISYKGGKAILAVGPPAQAREVLGSYWIIQARSREEAIEWARRAPMSDNEIIEVRQIYDASGPPTDAQAAA
jgi:hypothetical protein